MSVGESDANVGQAPQDSSTTSAASKQPSTINEKSTRPHAQKQAATAKQSQSSAPAARASKRKPTRPSLVSRFIHALLPCVGPPSSEIPEEIVTEHGFSEKEKEARGLRTKESSTDHHSTEPSSTSTAVPLVPIDTKLTVTDDPAVIVPPTPRTHVLPESETHGLTSGAVQPPGSTGDETHLGEVSDDEAGHALLDVEEEERRLIASGGSGIPIGPDGTPQPLLPPLAPELKGRKCLVLDLDETLLHGSFKVIPQPDYIIPVEIEYNWHNIYALKRPGVDAFLKQMGEVYEVVVFTASLAKYANAVLDKLDVDGVISHRLFRESCFNHRGNYVKDLSQLGRPLEDTIILDNSPASYLFHPNNAVPVSSWFNDPHDTELTDLCPFLVDLATSEDVRGVLDSAL